MKANITKISIEEYITKHNPFVFKNEKNEFEYYPTYKEAYVALFKRMHKLFPKGYVEMVLFLIAHCSYLLCDAKNDVDRWRKLGYQGDPQVIDWSGRDRDPTIQLMIICRCMHTITETPFDEAMFSDAINEFNYYLKMKKDE